MGYKHIKNWSEELIKNPVQLKIGCSMICSACAKAKEKAIGKLPSAKDVSVNYSTEKLSVNEKSVNVQVYENVKIVTVKEAI